MCFLKSEKHPKVKIAKKDIVCYKRFDITYSKRYFRSPIMGYRYDKGFTYYEDSLCRQDYNPSPYNNLVHMGFHSYSSILRCKLEKCSDELVVKCIIPEGAHYWYNEENKEYCSDYITIGTDKDIVK